MASLSKNKSKDSLEQLFGSGLRLKIMKFIFRNYPAVFGLREMSRRIQEPLEDVSKELKNLAEIGLIYRKR